MTRLVLVPSLVVLLAAPLTLGTRAQAQDVVPADAPVLEVVESPDLETTVQVRSGQDDSDVTVTGASDHTVFAGGRRVQIDATAADAFAAGERVTLRGEVLDNFLGAGQDVTIDGPVGGDAFLLGENLELGADVGGDVYAAGESLFVPEGVSIGGNLYFGGATLELDGTVGGSLLGGSGDIGIDGTVAGDVRVDAGDVRIGPGATIGGDLSYESPEQGDVSDLAAIGGLVDWTEKVQSVRDHSDSGSSFGGALFRLFLFLGSLIIGSVLLVLFPRVVSRPAEVLEQEAPVSLGIGFAALIGVPVLALVLALFILPIPLSLLSMAVYVPALVLARYVAAYTVGKLVLERLGRSAKPFGALVAGLALLHLVYAVPLVGGLVSLCATVLGLGALFLAARRAAGPMDEPAVA